MQLSSNGGEAMRQIIFGTKNPAKLAQVRGALQGLNLEVSGLEGFNNLPDVAEDGKTAQENARKKAMAFAEATGQMVFSMDNALYFENIPDDLQPGTNVRRIPGHTERPTDEELIGYYSNLAKENGGELGAYWYYAIAIADPHGIIKEVVAKTPRRRFVSTPCPKMVSGYPLESLMIDIKSGKYIAEMSRAEQDAYWQDTLGYQLKKIFTETFDNL